MNRDKQIEEMEQLVRSVIYQENDKGFANGFDALCTATEYLTEKITEALYNAGYRKQSDVVREIIDTIKDNFEIGYGGVFEFYKLLDELKIKYQ